MKFLYILPVLFGLAACNEKPIYTVDNLDCKTVGEKVTFTIPTKIEFYKDYAIVEIPDNKTKVMLLETSSYKTNKVNTYGTKSEVTAVLLNHKDISIETNSGDFKFYCYFKDGDSFSEHKELDTKIVEKIFEFK